MKKKIFLITAMVALLICVFAITVSAANEVTLTDGTTANLENVFNVDGSTVNGFKTGYSKDNVKDVVFPSSITTVKNVSFENSTVLETATFEAFETLELDNVSFKASSIQKATFNPECVLNYKSGTFYGCKSMTEITFPKFLGLTGNCFQSNSNMEPTNGIVFVEGITTINCHIFNGCTKVGGTVAIPASVKEIKEGTFSGTSITAFDFSKCVNLTSMGGGYGTTFNNIDTITSYDFSACTSLTEFKGGSMFEGSAELTEIILPPNLTKIPSKTLAHCYKLQSVVIPASVTEIVSEAFHSARAGQTVKTFTMYIQGNVKLDTKYVFRDTSAKIELVLLGDSITAEQFKTTNAGIDIVQNGSHSPMNNIAIVDYKDPASPWTYQVGQSITNHVIVENYCTPLALTGEHKIVANPCVINCTSCGLLEAKENPEHNETVSIEYENGYGKEGSKIVYCTNEGCKHNVTEKVEALFICLGYSTAEFANGGISIGFYANEAAIDDYEKLTGEEVSYGVFAGTKAGLGTNDVIGEDGKAVDGTIVAGFENSKYSFMYIKMYGFNEDNKDTLFAIGAYVEVTDEESKTYSYLQVGAPNENEKYEFIKYSDFKK